MGRIFTESFDLETLDQFSSSTDAAVIESNLGGGDYALEIDDSGSIEKTFASAAGEKFYGFFAEFDETNDASKRILLWKNGSTVLGSVRFNSSNRKVEGYTGDGGGETLRGTSTVVWNDLARHHVAVRVKLGNGGSGRLQVKIDNVLQIDFSGDTQPGSETTIDGFECIAGSGKSRYAAFYINNTSGSLLRENTWQSALRMRGRKAVADGFHDQFDRDPASPTTAFSHVDETGAPSPTDIISEDTNGNKQSLRFNSHGLIGAAVQSNSFMWHMRKVTDGQGKHGLRKRTPGTTIMDSASEVLGTGFETHIFRYPKNPHTTLDWTLNEAQEDQYESVMEAVV